MKNDLISVFESCPVVAAVKNPEQLERCIRSQSEVMFFLCGEVGTIEDMVRRAKQADKLVIVHVDLISGLSNKESAVDFIKKYTEADGIISTRPQTIRHANSLGLFTVLRLFMLDSLALDNVEKQIGNCDPDMVEILPGLMPRIIEDICDMVSVPLIAGGLIAEKGDVVAALRAGATCVSTTKESLWAI